MIVAYRVDAARQQAILHEPAFRYWRLPQNDDIWCEFYREDQGYRIRFPNLADFLLSVDGRDLLAIPVPDTDAETLEHLYLNQVLPLALSKQGEPVFHASAVEVDGQAIAFIGESGRGKSTLATHMVLSGAGLLTDDSLLLADDSVGYRVVPSHASVRLWSDSREALVGDQMRDAPAVKYTSKSRLLAGDAIRHCTESARLKRAYFLGSGDCEHISIEPVGAADAALEWIRHSFLLDLEEKPRLASHFGQVGKLASLGLSFRLDYPRDYDRLPDLRLALLDHLTQPAAGR